MIAVCLHTLQLYSSACTVSMLPAPGTALTGSAWSWAPHAHAWHTVILQQHCFSALPEAVEPLLWVPLNLPTASASSALCTNPYSSCNGPQLPCLPACPRHFSSICSPQHCHPARACLEPQARPILLSVTVAILIHNSTLHYTAAAPCNTLQLLLVLHCSCPLYCIAAAPLRPCCCPPHQAWRSTPTARTPSCPTAARGCGLGPR